MRVSILSSIFLAASVAIAVPLVERRFPSDTDLESREFNDEIADLYIRDEVPFAFEARDVESFDIEARDMDEFDLEARDMDAFDIEARDVEEFELERRAKKAPTPKKPTTPATPAPKTPATNPQKIANKQAKKDNKKAAKAEVKAAGPDAAAKKAELKQKAQDKNNVLKAAAKDYKGTQGLPDRNAKFNVPAGGGKPEHNFTGKDVRKSQFAAHVNNKQNQADKGGQLQPFGKEFKNKPHANAGTSGTTKPLDGMTGKGKEHPFSQKTDDAGRKADHTAQPVRIITKYDPKTNKHNHAGVIAHDQSRTSGKDMNDHFEVKPTP